MWRTGTRAMSAAVRPPALLDARSVDALKALGLEAIDASGASLFEAQRACWPAMSAGAHTFVTAPTGTGKSVLAVLRACTVATKREEGATTLHPSAGVALPRALVVAPTRELADQHAQVATTFLDASEERAGGAMLIAGGEKHAVQRRALAAAQPAVVVGTPGRILAHVAQNHLSLHRVRCVVFDEADCLFAPDGGFWLELRQLLQLLRATPAGRKDAKDEDAHRADADAQQAAEAEAEGASAVPLRARKERPPRIQLLLTAATADAQTLDAAARLAPRLRVPFQGFALDRVDEPPAGTAAAATSVATAGGLDAAASPSIKHEWLKLLRPGDSKLRELSARIKPGCAPTLVFTNSMASCMAAWRSLWERGLEASRFHGGMEPEERDAALARMRSGAASVLVTTDVAMRGLDLPAVARVINFDFPESAQQFIHRAGRTGRARAKGTAVHFIGSHADWVLARQFRDPVQLSALIAAGPPAPAEHEPPPRERAHDGGERRAPRSRRDAALAAAAEALADAELEAEDVALASGAQRTSRGAPAPARSPRELAAPRAVGGAYSVRGEAGRGRVVLRAKGQRATEVEAARAADARRGDGVGDEEVRFVRSSYTPALRSARRKPPPGARAARAPAESEYDEVRYVELSEATGEPLERIKRVRRDGAPTRETRPGAPAHPARDQRPPAAETTRETTRWRVATPRTTRPPPQPRGGHERY